MTVTTPVPSSTAPAEAVADLLDLLRGDEGVGDYEGWRDRAALAGLDERLAERLHATALSIRSMLEDRRRRESELVAIATTALELGAVRDVERLLRAISERARDLLRTEIAYLTLVDRERGDVYVRVAVGTQTESFSRIRLSLGSGLGGLVAATATPCWTEDMRSDARIVHTREIREATGAEGLVAVAAVPLLLDGEVIGVLYAGDRSPRSFSHNEISLLTSLGAHAVVALHNARLFDETQAALAAAKQAVDALEAQAASLQRTDRLRRRFMEIAVHGGSLGDVAEAVVGSLGGRLTVLAAAGDVLATVGVVGDVRDGEDGLDGGHDDAGAVETDLHEGARQAMASGHATPTRLATGQGMPDAVVVPLVARGDVLGALVHQPAGLDFDDNLPALQSGAVVLALIMLGQRAARDAEERLRGDLLDELIRGRVSDDEARRRARLIGLALDPDLAVAAVAVPSEARRRALHACRAVAQQRGGLAALVDEHLAVLVPGSVREVANALHRQLAADRIGAAVVAAAAGSLSPGVSAAFTLSTRSIAALHALGRFDVAATPDDLGAITPMLAGADPAVVRSFILTALGPLIDYDRRRDTQLIETLRAVYESGMALQSAAERLHVHVNTLHQRLERINDLLGVNWRDPARALDLQLALVLLQVAGIDAA